MRVAFPAPVRVQSSIPRLEGMRLGTFTNIDGEAFARPALNGFWRLDMTLIAYGMQSELALAAFVTAMRGHARSVVPICSKWRPNDDRGYPLGRGGMAPEYTLEHTGFMGEPFDGFRLAASALHRDSHIDVTKPALSHLWPGMLVTLGDRLHRVVNVTTLTDTSVRASIMPPIRGGYPAGEIVVVDQLRLLCQMESGDPVGTDTSPFKTARMSFIEAFGDPAPAGVVEPMPEPDQGTPFDFVSVFEAATQ